jgi:hypothetical protein
MKGGRMLFRPLLYYLLTKMNISLAFPSHFPRISLASPSHLPYSEGGECQTKVYHLSCTVQYRLRVSFFLGLKNRGYQQ